MRYEKCSVKDRLIKMWEVMRHPIVATIFGLLVGAIVIIISGENPINVYKEMFSKSFFSSYYLGQTLTRATPIMICGIATAAAWRAGYINIGVEGQMITGAFVATLAGIYIPGPPIFVMIIAIILGMLAGALYAVIAARLNYKYNVPLVICTLMMNYIANYIATYFVTFPFKDPGGDGLACQSVVINENIRFLKIGSKSTLNIGFIIAILIVLLFIFVSKKTVFGYESKMTGLNPNFAKYGGVKQVRVMLITMALSGAIAAMAGITDIYGVKFRYIDSMFTSTSYAWTGLMSALIANLHPVGIFFSSIFLAGLQVGGQSIQRAYNVPLQLSTVIQSCITLFVSVKISFSFIRKNKTKKIEVAKDGGEL